MLRIEKVDQKSKNRECWPTDLPSFDEQLPKVVLADVETEVEAENLEAAEVGPEAVSLAEADLGVGQVQSPGQKRIDFGLRYIVLYK